MARSSGVLLTFTLIVGYRDIDCLCGSHTCVIHAFERQRVHTTVIAAARALGWRVPGGWSCNLPLGRAGAVVPRDADDAARRVGVFRHAHRHGYGYYLSVRWPQTVR